MWDSNTNVNNVMIIPCLLHGSHLLLCGSRFVHETTRDYMTSTRDNKHQIGYPWKNPYVVNNTEGTANISHTTG